jgi:hypothetical protein
MRRAWHTAGDAELLRQCEVDTYRASGPGGQKRNKTSSAVRLRHRPSGLSVIAEESRSQHDNRAKALQRLRRAFALELREQLAPDRLAPGGCAADPDWLAAVTDAGRLRVSPRDERFWAAAALALDVFAAAEAQVSTAAAALGVSTGHLIDFFQADPKLWQKAGEWRLRHGHKPLR